MTVPPAGDGSGLVSARHSPPPEGFSNMDRAVGGARERAKA